MEADFTNVETPSLIMEQVERSLGHATILINNATYCVPSNYKSLDINILDQHYAVNNRGPILLSTEFANRFEKTKLKGHRAELFLWFQKGPILIIWLI